MSTVAKRFKPQPLQAIHTIFCSDCAGHFDETRAVINRAEALMITWSHRSGTKSQNIVCIAFRGYGLNLFATLASTE